MTPLQAKALADELTDRMARPRQSPLAGCISINTSTCSDPDCGCMRRTR